MQPATETCKRPRFRNSIRGMMLVVLFFAVGLSWQVNKARTQSRAVVAAQRWGGSLYFDYDFNSQGRFAPNARPPWGPRWLHDLLGPEYFRTLRTIWIRNQAPDSELAFLDGLTELRTLHLNGTGVTDSRLSCLRSMPRLWGLDLMRCPKIGDASAQHIGRLTELKELYLSDSRVTDAGLSCVRSNQKLRVLHLSNLRVTDAGLVNLAGLTGLEILALNGTKVTDAGMVHLKGLTGLKILWLNETKVTDEGVAELQKALPTTEISRGKL